jgi:hypothetical protein
MFRTIPLSIIRSFSLYTQQQIFVMLVMLTANEVRIDLTSLADSSCDRAPWQILIIKPTRCTNFSNLFWNSILILLASCLQTCMTYTIAVRTVKNSWWWTEELSEICRFSFQNKFEKLVHLAGFIVRILLFCSRTLHARIFLEKPTVVQWKTPDDGHRNCPKHVDFHSKINLRN